ncbi:hypothetical protein ACFQV2_27235 [Actinokineospora soli]|uniref:Uncharacterized protein n=1 Tax=Actinokineospora soli TaxID=1048753 RepID=A0ABW2TUW8_9PSEU
MAPMTRPSTVSPFSHAGGVLPHVGLSRSRTRPSAHRNDGSSNTVSPNQVAQPSVHAQPSELARCR